MYFLSKCSRITGPSGHSQNAPIISGFALSKISQLGGLLTVTTAWRRDALLADAFLANHRRVIPSTHQRAVTALIAFRAEDQDGEAADDQSQHNAMMDIVAGSAWTGACRKRCDA